MQTTPKFVREFDLAVARKNPSKRSPAIHQVEALSKLRSWYEQGLKARAASKQKDVRRGGLLVLPTGGGKTFSAMRFLCKAPLSSGYKVLWLAHTHTLLRRCARRLSDTSRSTGCCRATAG